MIEIGKLRQRVTLEAPTRTPDAYGQKRPSWAAVAEVWASVEPLSGRKAEIAKQVHPETTHHVTIRYRPGVTTEMRVIHEGRSLNILAAIDPEERHEKLILHCAERADGVRNQG